MNERQDATAPRCAIEPGAEFMGRMVRNQRDAVRRGVRRSKAIGVGVDVAAADRAVRDRRVSTGKWT
ncbi:MAG: hypothetical protein DWI09_08520 [Planctomycetota bacterium]|nr:MAG: hypothetical protein DWI09_08520 [Planctomycetota bacterium]